MTLPKPSDTLFPSEVARIGAQQAPVGFFRDGLLDEICDPLEVIANLVFLLEDDAGDRTKVLESRRLLAYELTRVLQAVRRHMESDFYTDQRS